MTKMLEFHLKDQMLNGGFPVVSDSRNIVFAHFVLDIEPTGSVTAIFRGPTSKPYCVLLDESHICEIPWEVLVLSEKTATSYFSVSLVIGERLTTSCAIVPLIPSGYAEGETPGPPTPSVYEKILNSIKTPYIGENGNWYEWDMNTQTFIDTGIKSTGADGQKGDSGDSYVLTDTDKAEIANMVDVNSVIYLPSAKATYELLKGYIDAGKEVIITYENRYYQLQSADDYSIMFRSVYGERDAYILDFNSYGDVYDGYFPILTVGSVSHGYNPLDDAPISGQGVAKALKTVPVEQPLKLIKTITLTEAVTSISTTFDKPLKELWVRFVGSLDGVTETVKDVTLAANANSGTQYFFWTNQCTFQPNKLNLFTFHSKEVVLNQWETRYGSSGVFAVEANQLEMGYRIQGLSAHSVTEKVNYSTRNPEQVSRFIDGLKFMEFNGKYSFSVGSYLEIWGVEGDEE